MAKIEEQVLSIEQMQHLKELGLEVKNTAMCWYEGYVVGSSDFFEEDLDYVADETLTLQEILEMLPKKIENKGIVFEFDSNYDLLKGYKIGYIIKQRSIFNNIIFIHKNPLICAYNALCWIAENGYLNKE